MAIESELLRQAMRYWATGVTIVTAAHAGIQHGMTVSSFTSVSLAPAQVLVSLAQNTRTHDLIMQ
ncbi:MAG: flavin reductase family protein, partial [Chloroflexota bacterium]